MDAINLHTICQSYTSVSCVRKSFTKNKLIPYSGQLEWKLIHEVSQSVTSVNLIFLLNSAIAFEIKSHCCNHVLIIAQVNG